MLRISTFPILGIGILITLVTGCQLWPFMSDEDGRRPIAMGKNDQVLYPYNAQPIHLSEDYGQSFYAARENQILNPQAAKNLDPVTGMNGPILEQSLNRFQKMFAKPPFEGGGKGGGSK